MDLLFSLNGLPLATAELKNPAIGQSWRHAVRQYQQDRDPRAPLFGFKRRALVLLAVACSVLDRQVERLAQDFEKEGGFTERLYRVRTANRRQVR